MKRFQLFLILSVLAAVGCGGKNKSSSSDSPFQGFYIEGSAKGLEYFNNPNYCDKVFIDKSGDKVAGKFGYVSTKSNSLVRIDAQGNIADISGFYEDGQPVNRSIEAVRVDKKGVVHSPEITRMSQEAKKKDPNAVVSMTMAFEPGGSILKVSMSMKLTKEDAGLNNHIEIILKRVPNAQVMEMKSKILGCIANAKAAASAAPAKDTTPATPATPPQK